MFHVHYFRKHFEILYLQYEKCYVNTSSVSPSLAKAALLENAKCKGKQVLADKQEKTYIFFSFYFISDFQISGQNPSIHPQFQILTVYLLYVTGFNLELNMKCLELFFIGRQEPSYARSLGNKLPQ